MSAASANHKTPIYKVLYFQVICAIVIGILLGFLAPEIGAQMKPFGDGFIRLINLWTTHSCQARCQVFSAAGGA